MNDPLIPIELTWEQWGMILIPLYIALIFWARWCLQRTRPAPPVRRTKGAHDGSTR